MFFSILLVIFSSLNSFASEPPLIIHSERPLQAESTYEALQPFETPISGFFIRSHHDVPVLDFDNHTLKINGLVENPIEISVKELRKLPQTNFYAVLECSGNKRGFQIPSAGGIQWSEGAVGNAEWEGVSLALLLKKAKPKKDAKYITVRGADKPALPSTPEFIRSIPLAKALEPNTLLALKMNREPLPLLHGGPVRLILPHWYAQNWIKWVTEISLTSEEDPGFYMKKAYRMPKTPLKPGQNWNPEDGLPIQELLVQSLIVSPQPNEAISEGKITIKGKAFTGTGGISAVDVSSDGGKSWKKTTLLPANRMGGWREFEWETERLKPGSYTFISRAKDDRGGIQPMVHPWNPPGYLRNAVTGTHFVVLDSKEFEGSVTYRNQCLICHTDGLIASQKFDQKGWKKLLAKMKSFGAQIESKEEEPLIKFLLGLTKRKTQHQKLTLFSVQDIKYSTPSQASRPLEESSKLYSTNCAQCHGSDGQGQNGPRLRGRLVPKEIFTHTVEFGKNRMPAFGGSLTREQILGLWTFLQTTP